MTSTLMKGVVRHGRVETDEPINLPDGTELLIAVQNDKAVDSEPDWDVSPEGIANWLHWCDALEPLNITDAEQADTDAWLKKMNALGSADMNQGN